VRREAKVDELDVRPGVGPGQDPVFELQVAVADSQGVDERDGADHLTDGLAGVLLRYAVFWVGAVCVCVLVIVLVVVWQRQ